MGFGGSGKAQQDQLNSQLQLMGYQQQILNSQQADYATAAAARDASVQQDAAQTSANLSAANQTSAKLGVLDYIHTSPQGLGNQPTSGKLTLLGN